MKVEEGALHVALLALEQIGALTRIGHGQSALYAASLQYASLQGALLPPEGELVLTRACLSQHLQDRYGPDLYALLGEAPFTEVLHVHDITVRPNQDAGTMSAVQQAETLLRPAVLSPLSTMSSKGAVSAVYV